ncbi:hypothetical protein [Deinococcus roseus]|uniref:Uncharacterized protein n=1 Tax=Deinococcus roseus TaxID=392414 RepID=A0ABQ2D3N5_9DEIO|nr:hypothetical protein [Deinococcus roseus]GGJ44073.1 hypothetical protein GCM10008938_32940 [Deinococcus roseus]
MFIVHVVRKHRSPLGNYPSLQAAQQAALAWWAEACREDPEDVKGTWLETYDHERGVRLWVFIPDFALLQASRWRLPGCEIRPVA